MPPTFTSNRQRRLSPIAGVSRSSLEEEAPALVPLLDQHPSINIYTRSTSAFQKTSFFVGHDRVHELPLAVVRPVSEDEVAATVRVCVGSSPAIPITILSGGHDQFGRSCVADGVVIDLIRLDKIVVADDKKSARIGGGVVGIDLLEFLESHGLATPTGWSDSVGYVGWSTGGGYGVMQGAYGFGVDQILGARIVTADGVVVDTDDDPDLLWALKGAGTGGFGVIVELRSKVYPVPKILAGLMVFPLEDAQNVLPAVADQGDGNPPVEFSREFITGTLPGFGPALMYLVSWIPKPGYSGDLNEGKAYIDWFRSLGKVLMDTVAETTPHGYLTTMKFFGDSEPGAVARAILVKGLTPEVAKILSKPELVEKCLIVAHTATGPSTKPNSAACFPYRMPHLNIGIFGNPKEEDEADVKAVIQAAEDAIQELVDSGSALRGAYMSFSPPAFCRTLDFFGASTTEWLRVVKRKYDSSNVFFKGYPDLS